MNPILDGQKIDIASPGTWRRKLGIQVSPGPKGDKGDPGKDAGGLLIVAAEDIPAFSVVTSKGKVVSGSTKRACTVAAIVPLDRSVAVSAGSASRSAAGC